jgi:hypothetical protein
LEVDPAGGAVAPPLLDGDEVEVVDVTFALALVAAPACLFVDEPPPHDARAPALSSSSSEAAHAGARRLRLHCVIETPLDPRPDGAPRVAAPRMAASTP